MAWLYSKDEFNRIMERYGNDVYRLAMMKVRNPEDASDIYQEVFLKLYHCTSKFESDEHIKAWLLKVTANASVDLLRTVWKSRVTSLNEDVNNGVNNSYSDVGYEDSKDQTIWAEVGRLPERYRVVLHLYYYEGYDTDEISRILEMKPSTIRSRLNRARKILRERLGDSYVSE